MNTIIRGFTYAQWRHIRLHISSVRSGRWQTQRNREEDVTQDFVVQEGCHDSEEDCCLHD